MKDKSISVLWCLAVFYGCQRHDDNSRIYYLSGRLSELSTKIESIEKRFGHRMDELGKSVQEVEGRVVNEDHPKLNLFGKSSYLIKTKVGYLTLSSQSAVDSNGAAVVRLLVGNTSSVDIDHGTLSLEVVRSGRQQKFEVKRELVDLKAGGLTEVQVSIPKTQVDDIEQVTASLSIDSFMFRSNH